MQGVSVAIQHLTRPGDGIVLHMPAYHPFLETIAAAGRRIVPVPAELVGGRVAVRPRRAGGQAPRRGSRRGPPAAALPSAQSARPRVHPGRARAARRDLDPSRPRRRQRRDPRRARPPAPRPRPVRRPRRRGRGADRHRHVGVEGVQPRRAAVGDPARRSRRAAVGARRAHAALLRRAEPDGRGGHGGRVERRRRVATRRRRPARRQPDPSHRRSSPSTSPASATRCRTRRTSRGSTSGRSASATTRPRRFASGVSS